MVADPVVIVAARQAYNNLDLYPGMTAPDAEAIRQLYERDGCQTLQFVDSKLVADSVDAGLLWWGCMLGMSVAIGIACVVRVGRKGWS